MDWRSLARDALAMRVAYLACAALIGTNAAVTMTTTEIDPPSLLPWAACLLAVAVAAIAGIGAVRLARLDGARRAGYVAAGCLAGVVMLELGHLVAIAAHARDTIALDGLAMLSGAVAMIVMLDAVRSLARAVARDDLGRSAWHAGLAMIATFVVALVTRSYSARMTTQVAMACELAWAAVTITRIAAACRERAENLPRATVV
jgi:hypothetical protein